MDTHITILKAKKSAHLLRVCLEDIPTVTAAAKKTESNGPEFSNSYTHHTGNSQGCYVATCVYGSYDCPQVRTLRRFRDNSLARNPAGRAFVRTYYAVSPKIVKFFGNNRWFKNMWRGVLDNMVSRLNKQGIDNSPYEDLQW